MPTQIVKLEFVGDFDSSPYWQPDTIYETGDVVYYSGLVYRCTVEHRTVTDFEPTYWEEIPVVRPNDRVQINNGKTYGQTVVFYDTSIKAESTVPAYTLESAGLSNSTIQTRFDGYSTRFFNYRDSYAEPGTNDKYLKFPKYGVFK